MNVSSSSSRNSTIRRIRRRLRMLAILAVNVRELNESYCIAQKSNLEFDKDINNKTPEEISEEMASRASFEIFCRDELAKLNAGLDRYYNSRETIRKSDDVN